MNRISINIVTWNSLRFLPQALESIRQQTYRDFNVFIIDNGSTDGTVKFIKENYSEFAVLRNTKNLGFCKAHNQGINYAMTHWKLDEAMGNLSDKFILLMNPDVVLEPYYLDKLMQRIRKDNFLSVGSFGGKLLRAIHSDELGSPDDFKSEILDSTGIFISRNRNMRDRGAGSIDTGKFSETEEVFGISGALVLFRASALEEIKLGDEYLDEALFMYKDDVDLAWRLRNLGWKALYVSEAQAYHYRSASPPVFKSIREYIKARNSRSRSVNFYSYRNHFAVIFKNDFIKNFLLHLPFIFFYELKKFIFILIFEPATLLAVPSLLATLPNIFTKRSIILKRAKVSSREIRKWFK